VDNGSCGPRHALGALGASSAGIARQNVACFIAGRMAAGGWHMRDAHQHGRVCGSALRYGWNLTGIPYHLHSFSPLAPSPAPRASFLR
jgi:hypothetical protein